MNYFGNAEGEVWLSYNEDNRKEVTFSAGGDEWTPDISAVIRLEAMFSCIMEFLLTCCTLSEYLSQSRFKMRLQRRERDRTGKAEITRDRANLTETILRVCDSNNEKNGQNFISVFEMMKNKRIIG